MNLVTGNWIPVLYSHGESARIGLQKLFAESENIIDLAANPPQRVALMRLLVCIIQAALDGPRDQAEWKTCKNSIPAKAEEYLKNHLHEFELYGEKPFMQVPTLKHTYNATLDKLDFGLAAGNNDVLFDHGAYKNGREHDDGWTALRLLNYLVYSPGGLIGTTYWNSQITGKTSEHAPCVESSALHTYIRMADLLETIHINLISKDTINRVANMEWGRPTWELNRDKRANEELQVSVTTYLGRLVPLTRAIRLEKNRTTFTQANGISYPKFPECRESSATVIERRDSNNGYLPITLDRHPWRELNAVLTLGSVQGGPLTLANLMDYPRGNQTVEIWTGGLAADRGKILDAAEWALTVPINMIGNEGRLKEYGEGVEHAETAEKRLYNAVKIYADNMNLESTPMPKARIMFWSTLDQSYEILFETANSSTVSLDAKWRPLVQKAAYKAFDQACPHVTPRQIQAFAKARQKLSLKKI